MTENESILREKIAKSIKSRKNNSLDYFNRDNFLYLVFSIINFFLLGMMLQAYYPNPVMTKVVVLIILLQSGIIGYSIYVMFKFQKLQHLNDNIRTIIDRSINFYQLDYQIWLVLKPFILIISSFCFSALADREGNSYEIHNKFLYFCIYLIIYLVTYLLNRSFSSFYSKEYIAHLNILLDDSTEMDDSQTLRKAKAIPNFIFIFFLLLLLSIIFTLLVVYR